MIQRVQKPQRDFVTDYDTVRAIRRRLQVRETLQHIRERVLNSYIAYDEGLGSPVEVLPLDLTKEAVTALRGNYPHTYQRKVLGQLRADAFAAIDGEQCPMCGVGFLSDLDHYLPKESFPEFSVLALNLIPVCDRCNEKKSSLVGSKTGRFFHAYYDAVPESPSLLVVELDTSHDSVIVSFRINESLPNPLYRNALYHFDSLGLAEAYVAPAVEELIGRLLFFEEVHLNDGPGAVAYEAGRLAKHFRKNFGPQFWKASLYDAVKANRDFCDGGFKVLADQYS